MDFFLRLGVVCEVSVAFFGALGCDVNISAPPADNPPSAILTSPQNEPTVAVTPMSYVVSAYNDWSYVSCDEAPADQIPALLGISESRDNGVHWHRAAMPPTSRDCTPTATTPCITRIMGDPWLSEEAGDIYLVAQAQTNELCVPLDSGHTDAIILSRSIAGGAFSPWEIVAYDPTHGVDKPSIDTRGGIAVVTYISRSDEAAHAVIGLASSPAASWASVPFELDGQPISSLNPIVQMANENLFYVLIATTPDLPTVLTEITRVKRDTTSSPWQTSKIFSARTPYHSSWPVGGPAGTMRALFPQSLSVSVDTGGLPHLWLAYQAQLSSESANDRFILWNCVDDPARPCACPDPFCTIDQNPLEPWQVRPFDPGASHSYIFPGVKARDDGRNVRLTYYDYNPTTLEITPSGQFSTSGGISFLGRRLTSNPLPTALGLGPFVESYVPCTNEESFANYGDYFHTDFLTSAADADPLAITVFVDSRGGCTATGGDQHIQASLW